MTEEMGLLGVHVSREGLSPEGSSLGDYAQFFKTLASKLETAVEEVDCNRQLECKTLVRDVATEILSVVRLLDPNFSVEDVLKEFDEEAKAAHEKKIALVVDQLVHQFMRTDETVEEDPKS